MTASKGIMCLLQLFRKSRFIKPVGEVIFYFAGSIPSPD